MKRKFNLQPELYPETEIRTFLANSTKINFLVLISKSLFNKILTLRETEGRYAEIFCVVAALSKIISK